MPPAIQTQIANVDCDCRNCQWLYEWIVSCHDSRADDERSSCTALRVCRQSLLTSTRSWLIAACWKIVRCYT